MLRYLVTLIKKSSWISHQLRKDAYLHFRYIITLCLAKRENDTFTGFLRLPTQFEALTEQCLKYFAAKRGIHKLKICVAGCSNGAEAYTISSVLQNRHPDLDFGIRAFDINPEMIKQARTASYQKDEVLNNKIITDDFLQATFDIKDNAYKIKKKISERVFFMEGNILDSNFIKAERGFDIVFAQNFLLHLKRKNMVKAFKNIAVLLKNKAVLFIDGMDLDLREKLTREKGYTPLNYKIEKIHNEARRARAIGWPYNYWGLEPFTSNRKKWQRRYATIFLKQQH
ncbi:MAG: hypothetical protein HF978_04680 [Desulfobacteraceae bacterium]|nr:hypothetical protein [Desulfobacteraceae bacterium]MBC2754825.1 hypothetical protein [Desulfobacteraceae bacterium]